MSNQQAGGVVTHLTGIRCNVRVNDLSAKDRRDSRASFRDNGLNNCDIIHQVLRANVGMATIFGVRRTNRLLANFMFGDDALVSKRRTQLTLFQDPSYLCTRNFKLRLFYRGSVRFAVVLPWGDCVSTGMRGVVNLGNCLYRQGDGGSP